MKLYEFQAKELLRKYQIETPNGVVIDDLNDVSEAIQKLNAGIYVVKAQVLTGGRGKAGGVKLTKDKNEIPTLVEQILGMQIKEHTVKKVYIEEGVDIASEIYLSFLFDRSSSKHLVICSNEGGMEIEEVAAVSPEKVLKMTIDPLVGIKPYNLREVLSFLPYDKDILRKLSRLVTSLYEAFVKSDAELLEINPLIITKQGEIEIGRASCRERV